MIIKIWRVGAKIFTMICNVDDDEMLMIRFLVLRMLLLRCGGLYSVRTCSVASLAGSLEYPERKRIHP